jgi:hypothetical protein
MSIRRRLRGTSRLFGLVSLLSLAGLGCGSSSPAPTSMDSCNMRQEGAVNDGYADNLSLVFDDI